MTREEQSEFEWRREIESQKENNQSQLNNAIWKHKEDITLENLDKKKKQLMAIDYNIDWSEELLYRYEEDVKKLFGTKKVEKIEVNENKRREHYSYFNNIYDFLEKYLENLKSQNVSSQSYIIFSKIVHDFSKLLNAFSKGNVNIEIINKKLPEIVKKLYNFVEEEKTRINDEVKKAS